MNKEHIRLYIRELQEKMALLDERLLEDDEAVSALDLETQLMHLRMLYDSYLSLRPEGKKKGRGKKEKECAAPKGEESPEQVEEVETSLPLVFSEDVYETPMAETLAAEKKTPTEEKTIIEEQTKIEEASVEEVATEGHAAVEEVSLEKEEPQKEEIVEQTIEETAEETAAKAEESAPEAVAEEAPEVDLDLLEEPEGSDFDIDAIEFEEEADEEEETPVVKKDETPFDDDYAPYYPGLNPKAIEGEPEVGYASYASEKSPQTLGDRFVGQFPSLNDQLSQKRGEDRSLGSRKQKDQIHDLTKSIDLNLKFTFVRELFKGDARLLSEELNSLNQCGRLETALSTFEEMKQRYQWKDDKEAVQQLYELVLRKYAR